jgi:ABC-2 type transport system permease protein
MTVATAPARHGAITRTAPSSSFAGTGALLRLALRRDRIRIPAWAVFSAYLTVAVAQSWDRLYPTEAERKGLAATLAADPTLSAILGPLFDPLSTGGLTAWRISAGSLLAMGLVAAFLVVRHSRNDEDEGRVELVSGAPVGKAAPVTAGLGAAGVLLLAWALLSIALLAGFGLPLTGSVAFSLTQSLAALVFAAVASVTAQVARTSRGANGLAGLVIAACFLVTAFGNSREGGSVLQWLTPFGWAQQTRSYADERWWLVAVSAAAAAAVGAVALHLAARRDLGDALLAPRHGRANAAGWVRGPVSFAWRLDRTAVLVWALGFAAIGAIEGSLLTTSVDLVAKNPTFADMIRTLAGGTDNLNDAFLITMTGLFGLLAAGFGISIVLRLRAEEESGRTEVILTTPHPRAAWLAGHGSVALLGSTLLLAIGGLALGLVFGGGDGDALGQGWRAMLASLVAAPAVWLLVSVALVLVAAAPRWSWLAWIGLVWCVVTGYFGAILGLPDWLLKTSPFARLPLWPAMVMTWGTVLALSAISVALVVLAVTALRRRDTPR